MLIGIVRIVMTLVAALSAIIPILCMAEALMPQQGGINADGLMIIPAGVFGGIAGLLGVIAWLL